MKKILLATLLQGISSSCGNHQKDDGETTAEVQSKNETESKTENEISSPRPEKQIVLAGKNYKGIAGQGGSPQPGCEGCGNSGFISFIDDKRMSLLRPGDDRVFVFKYTQNDHTIVVENDVFVGSNYVFTLSDDWKTLSIDYGTFVLE